MYPVSAAYKTAIGQNVRDVRITGTITLKDNSVINITDDDIVQGSLYVTEQCVAGEDIEVGNVYASEMGLSLSTPIANPYSLDGARIHIYFGINVGSLWEYVPLGYFYVTEIQRKANNVNLTALDGMLLFDIPVGEPGSSSPRNFVVHACEQAGVTLGTSVFEIDTFANAGVLLAAPDVTKIKTARDLLMWACQIMGAFARMNRQGELEIVPIKARASVKTISKAERFNSDVSDFAVKITRVSMQVGEAEYSRGTDGMTMVLEENPLMTGLSESQINTVLDNLLAQITTAVYVPFNSNFIGDPALQPGDFVTLSDTSVLGGGDVASIITHSTWRYRGPHNIKGAGKHGLVRGVQNQQMKAVSSIVAIARAAQDLALAANQSTQLIKDAIGGHVLIRQNPDETNEILIMDNPDPDQAVKIWRWNMGGLGYSDNCVGADNPDREYDIAMTMDGAINANFIKTGRLGAGVVTIGPETTFAPGYDPSQIEGAVDPLRVDNRCKALFHFDGSINDHRGIMPTFARASKAYLSDGTEVDAGVPRFEDGKFDRAVLVEEGTTNLLTANQSSIETDTTGLAGQYGATITRDTTEYWNGNASLKVVTPGARNFEGVTASVTGMTLAVGDQYTASAWVKGAGTVLISLAESGSAYYVISGIPVTLTDDWQRITVTRTIINAANTTLSLFVWTYTTQATTFYVDGLQIEKKPYATSWQIGGTARAAETLTLPTAGVLNLQEGTIALWFKPYPAFWNGSYNRIIGHATAFNINELSLARLSTADKLICYASNASGQWSGGSYSALSSTTELEPNKWYHLAFTWKSGGKLVLYVNGVKEGEINYDKPPSVFGTLAVGYHPNISGRHADGLYDDLAIFDYAATDEEIEAWYEADAPFYALDLPKPELPGYVKIESDGLRVYDNAGKLRGVFGSWLKELIRKYGIKIIDGEIYSTMFQTGEEGATTYIRIDPDGNFSAYKDGKRIIFMQASTSEGRIRLGDGIDNPFKMSLIANYGIGSYTMSLLQGDGGLALKGGSGGFLLLPDGSMQALMGSGREFYVEGNHWVTGSKNAVMTTDNFGQRLLYCIEMPEVKFMDEGMAEIENGVCRIDIDPIFLEMIEPHSICPYIIHLTPYGWLNLRVAQIGDSYFVVEEKDGLSGKFSWRISATRKGYAGERMRSVDDEEDLLTSNWEDDLLEYAEQES